jgi:hypothetical protein
MTQEFRNQTAASAAPAVWRWTVLTAISVAMFGNYYAYDAVAPEVTKAVCDAICRG